jgi:hypothetical protein
VNMYLRYSTPTAERRIDNRTKWESAPAHDPFLRPDDDNDLSH